MNEKLKKRLQILRLQIEIEDTEEAQSTLELLATDIDTAGDLDVRLLLVVAEHLDAGYYDTALTLLDEVIASL